MQVSHPTIFDDLPRFDRTTVEWIAAFEGPSVAHLQDVPPQPCDMIDTLEVPNAMTADWIGSHKFPTIPFLNTPPCEEPAPLPACRRAAARANRKFTGSLATQDGAIASNLVGNLFICAL
jgi:hypothetical protein